MSLEDRSSLVVADSAERKPRDKGRKKEKGVAHFWRACGFLYPYRGMVVVSILCAVFVSAANTAGMGTLLPIMRVLVKHDTIATWADREIAQRRLGVKFSNDTRDLMIVSVEAGRPASVAGLKEQDALVAPPGKTRADMATLLAKLSTPGPTRATLIVRDGGCLLYTSPSPRDRQKSRMPSS